MVVGVIGSGAMGAGIAQVAAMAGHTVWIYDTQQAALENASAALKSNLTKLEEKGKIKDAASVFAAMHFVSSLSALAPCKLIIEAIVENLHIKKTVFSELETIVADDCLLASNTSSLSITSIAAACKLPQRVLGLHFFNPAPLMALVEIIPAIQTDASIITTMKELMTAWGKTPVIAKDTPGFIVNRVARPYYGEAIRMYEEGILRSSDRVHLLGTAFPYEFALYKDIPFIESIDTSNPIMATLEGSIYTDMGLTKKPVANMNNFQEIHIDDVNLDLLEYNVMKFRSINGL
jgi:3-hydroxybutyryl-CoA dehydrogenase